MLGRIIVAVGLIAATLAFVASACGGGSHPTAPPSLTASPRPTATPWGATSTSTVEATATATSAPGPPRVQVTGIFNGAPPASSQPVAVSRTLGPRPPSPFAAWDGKHTVVYDTQTGVEIDLGDASQVAFSPDSTRAAWIDGAGAGTATVMNLATGARRTYGDGTGVGFLDDRRLAVSQGQPSALKVFDVDTGQPSADQSIPPDQQWQPGYPSYPAAPAGYYWQIAPDTTTTLTRGGFGRNSFRLVEIASGATALQFDAVFSAPAGPGEIVLGTPLDGVMTNIFVVDIQTGKAEFVARARYGRGPNWPLSATERYVLWTDNYCWMPGVDPPQGHLQLYDRATKTLTDIADGIPPDSLQQESLRYGRLTPGGLIALGSFGASALIDPVSLSHTAVLPGGVSPSFRSWSPDYRYASYAPGGGHGGLC